MTDPIVVVRSDDLQATIRGLITTSDRLLATLGKEGRQAYVEAVDGMQVQLQRAREELDDMQSAARYEMRVAGRLVDQYVQENPWSAVGVAAVVGAVVGALVATLVSRR
jgi:ElaB/YqjD/DUF883 family membrane-anchored ribosome-binding protein